MLHEKFKRVNSHGIWLQLSWPNCLERKLSGNNNAGFGKGKTLEEQRLYLDNYYRKLYCTNEEHDMWVTPAQRDASFDWQNADPGKHELH